MGLWSSIFGKSDPIVPQSAPDPVPTPAAAVRLRKEDFLSCIEDDDEIDPRLATVRGYLQLMIGEGNAGDWEQTALFRDYEALCLSAEVPVMPRLRFGAAIEPFGCRRWAVDAIRKGRRVRPNMVRIPKSLKVNSNVLPWPELPQRAAV